MLLHFDTADSGIRLQENMNWIYSLNKIGINYNSMTPLFSDMIK
jgi:hypothetical protein